MADGRKYRTDTTEIMRSQKITIINDIDFLRKNFDRVKQILEEDNRLIVAISDPVTLFLRGKGIGLH